MINCHFVSRFARKPWEFGPRWLWYFDFERDGIYRASSETLFAVAGENTREVEERLNTLIETPISQVMVANRSVGHDGRRAVIPPAHRAAYTDAEITQTLKDLRADVVRLTNLMRQSNDLIRRMDLIG